MGMTYVCLQAQDWGKTATTEKYWNVPPFCIVFNLWLDHHMTMGRVIFTYFLLNGFLLLSFWTVSTFYSFTNHNLNKYDHYHHSFVQHFSPSDCGGAQMELLNLTELHGNLSRQNQIFFHHVPALMVGKRLAKVTGTKGQKFSSYKPKKVVSRSLFYI